MPTQDITVAATPTATIGVVAMLQPEYTRICLERLVACSLAQQGKLEIIVVLNGASERVASVAESISTQNSYIETVVNPSNLGYAGACNQVLERARSPYVGFVHNDALVACNTLEQMIYWLEKMSSQVVGILPLTNYANEEFPCIKEKKEQFLKIKKPNKHQQSRQEILDTLDELYGDMDEYSNELTEANRNRPVERCDEASSYCWIFRTRALRELGGFSPEFPLRGYEDKELWLRLEKDDLELALCRTAFVHHHGNLTSDGEGFTFPEVMASHGGIYRRIAEKHLHFEKPIRLPPRRQLVYISEQIEQCLETYNRPSGLSVLYFGTHYPPECAGGAEISLHETFRQLHNYGISTCAFTFRDRYHQKFEDFCSREFESTRVFQVPESGGDDLRQKLDFVIERVQPDLVVTHSGYAVHALEYLSVHFPDIKRIFAFRHQTDLTQGGLSAYLKDDGGTRIVSNSYWMQQVMLRACGRESDVVLPVVMPDSCTVPAGKARGKAIAIGNGVSSKGIRDLLDLASQLPEFTFDIWGSLDPAIPRSLLPTNARHRGWTSDIRDIYADTWLLLNLSTDPEPFGRTLMEAMYNGIPVVARNAGGPPEFVKHGGVLFDTLQEVPKIVRRFFDDAEFHAEKSAGTRLDTAQYNPYRERQRMVSLMLGTLGKTVRPEFAI